MKGLSETGHVVGEQEVKADEKGYAPAKCWADEALYNTVGGVDTSLGVL